MLTWRLPKRSGGYTLCGYSRAAEATAFAIPELELALDAGRIVHNAYPRTILISHTHSDHVLRLPSLQSRRKQPRIVAPVEGIGLIDAFVTASQRLTYAEPNPDLWEPLPKRYSLCGVRSGDVVRWSKGKASFVAEVIACVHKVPCVGYRLSRIVRKLKPEFDGLPGTDIAAARRAGVEVSHDVQAPILTWLGDTTHAVFERHPEALDAPVVMVECSFLEPEHHEAAQRTFHMHWADLEPIVRANPDVCFILTHLSLRYRVDAIWDFFDTHGLPDNAMLWLAPRGSSQGERGLRC